MDDILWFDIPKKKNNAVKVVAMLEDMIEVIICPLEAYVPDIVAQPWALRQRASKGVSLADGSYNDKLV